MPDTRTATRDDLTTALRDAATLLRSAASAAEAGRTPDPVMLRTVADSLEEVADRPTAD